MLGKVLHRFSAISLLPFLGIAHAATNSPVFTYQGRLLNESGTAPLTGTVTLTLGIYDPAGSCLLYEESQNVDLTGTNGAFSVQIGQAATSGGKRTGNDPNNAMSAVFANGSPIPAQVSGSCAGGSYTSVAGAGRKLRVTVTPQSTGVPVVLSPDQQVGNVPQATVAETVQGLAPGDLIVASGNVTQSNLAALTGTGDASTLHHHDSVYAKKDAAASFSSLTVGGANVCTTSYADTKFGGSTLDLTGLLANQSVKWDGAKWVAYTPSSGVSLGNATGTAMDAGSVPNCSAGQKLQMSAGPTFTWSCVSDSFAGTLGIAEGGTGQTTASAAFNALAPSQASHSGKFLTTDGTNASWATVPSSQWQTNSPNISFNTGNVGIGTTAPGARLEINGSSGATLKIVDGNQAQGKVLTSDSNGQGSWQTVNAARNSIIEPKCSNSTNSSYANPSCTPPSCPAGWTDIGVTNVVITAHNNVNAYNVGYNSRFCQANQVYNVIEPKCSNSTNNSYANPSCTPPACPAGWTDLGITNVVITAHNSSNGYNVGYNSRFCVQ